MAIALLFDRLGQWNPQLHRELRSRFTPANLTMAAGLSLVAQAGLYGLLRLILALSEQGDARSVDYASSRYFCASSQPEQAIAAWRFPLDHVAPICPDSDFAAATIPALNLPLWWLDLLVWLSGWSFAILLAGSLLLLLRDLRRETRAGTLNLVQLSAQPAASVLGGKLLGVPSLLYWGLLWVLPLQLWAAGQAGVPLSRVLAFDLGAIAATLGLQAMAAAIALGSSRSTPSPWLVEAAWLLAPAGTLAACSLLPAQGGNDLLAFGPLDAIKALHPLFVLPYVVGTAPHSLATIGYFNLKDWQQLTWFGWPLWNSLAVALSWLLLGWGAIAAVFWQRSLRRYAQPSLPLLSKGQSYALTAALSLVLLGFAGQDAGWAAYPDNLHRNLYLLLAGLLFWLLSLSFLLRPQRQVVLEHSRYRPLSRASLLRDLLSSDRAPASLAIALNAAIASAILLAGAVFAPLGAARGPFVACLLSSTSFVLLWALFWEALSWQAGRQHRQWLGSLLAAPAIALGSLGFGSFGPALSGSTLFAIVPWLLLGEWLAIALGTWYLLHRLRQLGCAETAALALPAAQRPLKV